MCEARFVHLARKSLSFVQDVCLATRIHPLPFDRCLLGRAALKRSVCSSSTDVFRSATVMDLFHALRAKSRTLEQVLLFVALLARAAISPPLLP